MTWKPNPNILYEVKVDDFHVIGYYTGKIEGKGASIYVFKIVEKILPWGLDEVYLAKPESNNNHKIIGDKESHPEYFL